MLGASCRLFVPTCAGEVHIYSPQAQRTLQWDGNIVLATCHPGVSKGLPHNHPVSGSVKCHGVLISDEACARPSCNSYLALAVRRLHSLRAARRHWVLVLMLVWPGFARCGLAYMARSPPLIFYSISLASSALHSSKSMYFCNVCIAFLSIDLNLRAESILDGIHSSTGYSVCAGHRLTQYFEMSRFIAKYIWC